MKRELENYLRKITSEDFILEKTADYKFGDFASNIAFRLAKQRGKPPLEVAEELVKRIKENDQDGIFEKVEAAAPGFVNLWVSNRVFLEHLSKIATASNTRLRNDGREEIASGTRNDGQKINLEFVSANPTGPLTMANGRGGFLGDVLANVLEYAGHEVTREYYINDAGVQIKKLGESVLAVLGLSKKSIEHYQGAYVAELAKKLKAKILKLHQGKIVSLREIPRRGDHSVPRNDDNFEEIGRLAAKELLARIKKSLKNVGIKHDIWFSEYKNLRQKGELKKTLAYLRERGMVYEKEGAVWLKTTEDGGQRTEDGKEGDDKDRVLVKSDGEPTYFLADLAYHYDKFIVRKFDKAIVIWGADHHGYAARLKSGIGALGVAPDKFQALIVQLIRLVRGGREVKMSKRKGEFITLDDLVKDVGKDAARFFFLLHTPGNHMDFDLALAKERSVKNPVYYLQYAAVRAGSILKKIQIKEYENLKLKDIKIESEAQEKLIKALTQLPDVILETTEDLEVSRLTRYAIDLARSFHNFYEKERVIENEQLMWSRLALVLAARKIFERLFNILGISMPKKM